jgi:hypothetical protein
MERMIFRPNRIGGVVAVAVCLPLFAIGLAVLLVEPCVGLFCAAVGVLGVCCGVGYLSRRIEADDVGLCCFPRWFGGFRVRWADVVSWSVKPADPIDNPNGCQILTLVVHGRLWSIQVADYEVGRPGFGVLLERVRSQVAEADLIDNNHC